MVAVALHQLDRPDILEDSGLVDHFSLQGRGGHWPRGRALAARLQEAGTRVSEAIADLPSLAEKKELLDAVLGGATIAQDAREHNRAREAVSRGPWNAICELVVDEAEHLALAAAPPHNNR